MAKKIMKYVLLVLMVLGVAITVANILETDLSSTKVKYVTYYEDPPDCTGDPKDCHDLTGSEG